MSFSINLPNRNGKGDPEKIDSSGHIVLIGANGSGKTRLGIWIEEQHQNQYTVHRISAQKALSIPEFAQLKNLEQAEKDLIFGRSDQHAAVGRKIHDRWGGTPATFLLSDYDKLLSLLFAKSSERDRKHAEETKQSQSYIPVADAPIDTIVKIWGDIMPHREIKFLDGKVLVKKTDEPEYHGKEMSDGERVALYFMGQCLCAPANSIIIVDEPEIHLHKSLVDKLWNKVEGLSQSKTIIYITHDLDFASSRTDANKIWIKSYSGNNAWTWTEVPDDESLPESMVLEVIGSRKKIMFCEGEAGSLDVTIYQIVYPNYHVIPRGSCTKVIESTKALRNNAALHHMNAVGIIDSDYRDHAEVIALLDHGIQTIAVAEIENIFCVESAVKVIAEHLNQDPNHVIGEVTKYISAALSSEIELQMSSMAEKRIQYLLGAFSKSSNDKSGLSNGLGVTLGRIDVEVIYKECKDAFDRAIASNSLDELLRVYNRKSLPSRISGILGLANGEYKKLLVRLIKGPKRQTLVAALQKYMPTMP
ncbi:MAG: ABC transporter ATP-binding protein [Deltaproteobacteria bacterium RBG_16_58_17]|nr:MAG: ABC transporter ATP-binding protein [Deltaproteobacteria bacterium RBG_16_58_17]